MTHIIRPLTTHDAQAWLTLWQGYQAFYQVDIASHTSELTWQRLLDANEPVFGAVALEEERLIGFVHWVVHRSTWTVNPTCYLQDLFVDSTQRGAGIGGALIEHVRTIAQQNGYAEVYWLTHESNDQAQKLYQKVAERPGFLQYCIPLNTP